MLTESKTRNHITDSRPGLVAMKNTSGVVIFLPTQEVGFINPAQITPPYVPFEIKRAGQLLLEAQSRHTDYASVATIANTSKLINVALITDMGNGIIAQPPLAAMVNAATTWIDEQDPSMQELVEINKNYQEERKWMWRMDHDNLPKGVNLRLVRLSSAMSKTEFSEQVGIGTNTLRDAEEGRTSSLFAAHQILTFNNFEQRQRRVAQRIKLDVANKPPQTLNEFDQESFGDNIRYFRLQRGLGVAELADRIQRSERVITRLESNRRVVPDSINAVFEELQIPIDIRKYLLKKYAYKEYELAVELRDTLYDTFYFTIPELTITEPPFSLYDRKAFNLIKGKDTFADAIATLRTHLGHQGKETDSRRSHLYALRKSKYVSEDYYVAGIAMDMGLSVLDNTSLFLQRLAAKEREKHQRGNLANLKKN